MTKGTQGETKAAHAFVHGRVQGVGFRYWTVSVARTYNIRGWVKNCPDSSVEIHAEADTGEVLAAFWEAVTTQHPRAYISDCTISRAQYEGYSGFEVWY